MYFLCANFTKYLLIILNSNIFMLIAGFVHKNCKYGLLMY